MDDTLELHVRSPAFNEERAVYSKGIGKYPPSDNSDLDYSSDYSSLWEKDSSSSSVSSVEPSRHDASKLEAHLYYFGIRGPKLIFRTSRDVFTAGPEQDPRLMRLRPVTFHSSNDILDLLKEHGNSDVDVAYRELVARGFSGPELFAPVSDLDPPKAAIDPVTTALGLPIAGLKTLKSQGTMGFYFRVGKGLYAVTARHVLFPEDEGNNLYSYVGTFFSPRR